jgi:tetratricopeptide (TPR) repeat protein
MKYFIYIIILSVLVGCGANQTIQEIPDTSNRLSINYYAFGEAAFLDQDMESAVAFFKKADTADPNNIQIKERLLETMAMASYQNEAYKAEILELGESYYQQDLYTPRMLLILADAYRLQELFNEADKYYLLGIELEPTMQLFLHYYNFRENYFPPADDKWLDKAMKMPWNNRDDVLMLGELFGRKDAEKGLEILTEAYERWGDEKSMGLLLSAFDKKGEKSKILKLIQKRIDENKPVTVPVKAFLITRYFAQKEFEKVIDLQHDCFAIGTDDVLKSLFFSAINLNAYEIGIQAGLALEELGTIPAEMMISFNSYLAKLYFDSEQNDKTLEYLLKSDDLKTITNLVFQYDFENNDQILQKILILLEGYRKATNNKDDIAYILALIYSNSRDYDKSIAAMDDVPLEYLLENDLTIAAATIYLQDAKNVDKARELIELAQPDSQFTTNDIIAGILYGTEHDSLAFEICRQEITNNETPKSTIFLQYALVAEKFDFKANIITIIKRGLEMYPDNLDLMNAVGYMIADEQIEEEYELSKQLLEKAVLIAPENEMIWDSLAWIYFRLGLYKEALKAMELPIKKEVKNSEIAYHLGEIYLKLEKKMKLRFI